jgi:hypothetical protein
MTKYLLLLFTFVLFSCGKTPEIPGFDSSAWKDDPMGCKGKRKTGAEILLKNRETLQGVNENDLVKVLGRADKIIFYERKIKNLMFYVEPGGQCEGSDGKEGRRIIVELNALGNVTWINEEHI